MKIIRAFKILFNSFNSFKLFVKYRGIFHPKIEYIGYRWNFSLGYIYLAINDLIIVSKDNKRKNFTVFNSPHYKFIASDDFEYINYYQENFNEVSITEQLEKFSTLNNEILDEDIYIYIRSSKLEHGKFIIIDGAHRSAIALNRNLNKIKCYL